MTPIQRDQVLTNATPEQLREIYERARQEFTDEKLQQYLVPENGIPLEDVLKELEAEERQRKLKS